MSFNKEREKELQALANDIVSEIGLPKLKEETLYRLRRRIDARILQKYGYDVACGIACEADKIFENIKHRIGQATRVVNEVCYLYGLVSCHVGKRICLVQLRELKKNRNGNAKNKRRGGRNGREEKSF